MFYITEMLINREREGSMEVDELVLAKLISGELACQYRYHQCKYL